MNYKLRDVCQEHSLNREIVYKFMQRNDIVIGVRNEDLQRFKRSLKKSKKQNKKRNKTGFVCNLNTKQKVVKAVDIADSITPKIKRGYFYKLLREHEIHIGITEADIKKIKVYFSDYQLRRKNKEKYFKNILDMYHKDKMSYQDVADKVGKSFDTVYRYIYRDRIKREAKK